MSAALDWNDVVAIGLDLPEVECSTAYRMPALKVAGKLLTCVRDDGALVVRVDKEERALLLDAEPDRFYVTSHYRKYPSMLVRLDRIGRDELRELLIDAWLMQAPKRLRDKHAEQLAPEAR
jgi:hypothetical protein